MGTKREERRKRWRSLYDLYKGSGASSRGFCAERGVNYYTFREWQQRFDREVVGDFRELAVPTVPELQYSVVVKSGRELRLGAVFSETVVRKLIELLESC